MSINNIKLYQVLAERNSPFLENINRVYRYAKDILPLATNVFSSYTQHDVKHSTMVANYMFDILPHVEDFNDLELTLMILSALLHDVGMVVTDQEIAQIKNNTANIGCDYNVVLDTVKDEKTALQECIRPIHAKRSALHIQTQMDPTWFVLPNKTSISFASDLAKICQSHCEPPEWLTAEISKESVKDTYTYNPQYISLLLRLGDLLDIDETRTPLYLYQLINPQGYGDTEWRQHFVIQNVNKIFTDETTGQKSVRFYGTSNDPNIHRKLLTYFDYINQELSNAIRLSAAYHNEKYGIHFIPTVENRLETESFTFSDFRLSLDYKAVTSLLMGENIYGSKEYGLRELIQNAIDACLLMKEISQSDNRFLYQTYQPSIQVILDEDNQQVVIADNGVGMSLDILKRYFLNVGVSYYTSKEYRYKGYEYAPIGNYGIGFLACFMLSANVVVETKRHDETKLNKIELEKNSEYICLTQTASPHLQGTRIILDYNEFSHVFATKEDVQQFIETNFIDCGIPMKLITCKNGQLEETLCTLDALQENAETIARLDPYLNGMEGYIKIRKTNWGCITELERIDYDDAFIYFEDSGALMSANDVPVDIHDFIYDGRIEYLKVPIVDEYDVEEFANTLDILEDFDETLDRMDGSIGYINLFCVNPDLFKERECFDNGDCLIGNFSFLDFTERFDHDCRVPTRTARYRCNVITGDMPEILLYDDRAANNYYWNNRTKVFIRNVLVPGLKVQIPYVIDGLHLNTCLFNVKHKSVIPTVSRNTVLHQDMQKVAYAIGKALHLWILDHFHLTPSERILIENFIKTCYPDDNPFLR